MSKPRAVVEIDSDSFWVLASDWKRAFLVGPDDVATLILGGFGFGESEFALPIAMTHDHLGNLCILDYERRDLPCFGDNATVVKRIATGSANAALVAADTESLLVVSSFTPNTRFAARRVGVDPGPGEELIPLTEADALNGQVGTVGALTNALSHELLYAFPLAGTWGLITNGVVGRRGGQPLYVPNVIAVGERHIPRSVPWGAGQMEDDTIVLLVRHVIVEGDDPEAVRLRHTLEVYSVDGSHQGRAVIPESWGYPAFLDVGRDGRIYISRAEPHPAVMVVRLLQQPS